MKKNTSLINALSENRHNVQGYLYRKLGCSQLVADIFQDLAERVLRCPPRKHIQNPRSYLFQAASNAVIDYRRAEHSRQICQEHLYEQENEQTDLQNPERSLIAEELVHIIQQAIRELPPLTQEIFYLYRIEELSQQAIAGRLGISRSTVERHLRKAVNHWQRYLPDPEKK